MRTLLKIIGTILGIVIVLFIAIAVIIPVFFHPNDYKEEIAAVVQEKTGRSLDIEGDIVLSVFPWIAVELGALELGNAPGFPDDEFARLERMEVGVKLLPLLQKRLEVRTVKLHGLELNLAKDKNGRTNWSDLAALSSKGAQKDAMQKDRAPKQVEEDSTRHGMPLAVLGIGGLDIRNAALRWNDAQNGQHYRLEELNIETGAIAPKFPTESMTLQEPVDIEASFKIAGNKPRISGQVDSSAKFTADFAKQVFHLANLDVTGKLAGQSLPNGKLALGFKADIDADLAKQTLRAKNLTLTMGRIDANGAIAVTRLLDKPAFDGTLELEKFNPRALLTELGQQVPETADPKALASASLSTVIQGTTDRIHLKPLTIRLDETILNGTLAIDDFSALAVRFDLDLDSIDVDRYLPATKPSESDNPQGTPSPTTPGAAASQATRLPIDALRALNIHGKARIGKLAIANLKLSDLALDLRAKNGVIQAHPVKMDIYGGSYSGNVAIDARGEKIHISLDEELAGVQIGPLLRDLQGDDLVSGKLQFALDVNAVGATSEDLKKTLAGNTDFKFQNGMIKAIDIVHTVCSIANSILKQTGGASAADQGAPQGTEFQELTGQLPIENGRVHINKTLVLKAPMLRLEGVSGAIDIGADRFDNAKFIVKPSFTCEGQGGKAFDELSGLDIPITCNGPMGAPNCLDMETLTGSVLEGITNEFKKKAKEKVKQKVKEKTEKELKKILFKELGDKLTGEVGEDLGKALEGGLDNLLGR
uniref:AsmA protein n=1 Tax=Candidatus Kentrum sp. LFY TaxID=2126342 RepID=A0A450UTW6_9GAMM|nr:MAG: AsmA protein [Candidatus Kentron sp. LFY]